MILLDTDILTLLMAGNPRVVASLGRADDEVAITVIFRPCQKDGPDGHIS